MDPWISSKINYWFVPSLKHLALVKLASSLWDRSDFIRNVFSELFSYDRGIDMYHRLIVKQSVLKKVPELQLPRELEKLLTSYIHPVVHQILDWVDFHVIKYGYVTLTELPDEFEFFWTPQGYIDSKKVAQILVNDKRLDLYSRFELSCIYCLEEYIIDLLKILPEGFYRGKKLEQNVDLWTCYLFREMHLTGINMKLNPKKSTSANFAIIGFKLSVAAGNEAGTRYFLQRLTPEDRAELLVKYTRAMYCRHSMTMPNERCFSYSHYVNNIFYLLSEMSESEQTELVTVHALEILHYLLRWPWQCFFLRTAKKVWGSLNAENYHSLLEAIIDKIFSEDEKMHYESIFVEFWQQCSSAYKRHVIINGGLKSLLPVLIRVEDPECIKFIFNSTTVLEREEFIFCSTGQIICYTLIKAGKWKLFKFFIQECTSSKEVFCEFKEKLEKGLSCQVTITKDSNMLNKFHQLLFDVEHEYKRKCTYEEGSSLTKKISISI